MCVEGLKKGCSELHAALESGHGFKRELMQDNSNEHTSSEISARDSSKSGQGAEGLEEVLHRSVSFKVKFALWSGPKNASTPPPRVGGDTNCLLHQIVVRSGT